MLKQIAHALTIEPRLVAALALVVIPVLTAVWVMIPTK